MTVTAPGAREAAAWHLFADWCAAHGREALPADPLVLARFLTAHPAALGTQRRRVGVVNAAHRRAGHPPPGRAGAVREQLGSIRVAAARRRTPVAAAAISRLPAAGWPTALFARRDALLLVLSTTAMTYTAMAALRAGDVTADHGCGHLRVGAAGQQFVTPAELGSLGVCAEQVWRDWVRLRTVIHQLPAARWTAAALEGAPLPALRPLPADLPLFTPLDRWGSAPLAPTPLRSTTVAEIVAGHLSNNAAPHRPSKAPRWHDPDPAPEPDKPELPEPPAPLDPDSFARGLDARRRASEALDGIPAALDDVEDRAERLLADLLELLDG